MRHLNFAVMIGLAFAVALSGCRKAVDSDKGANSGAVSATHEAPVVSGGAMWGANYFPDIPLTTHRGEKVRFFTDLIKDKVVAINFIYTRCADACPMETARLLEVQRLLGDRL